MLDCLILFLVAIIQEQSELSSIKGNSRVKMLKSNPYIIHVEKKKSTSQKKRLRAVSVHLVSKKIEKQKKGTKCQCADALINPKYIKSQGKHCS